MKSQNNDGINNETMILLALNNRHYKDLSTKWKRHIKRMFKHIEDGDLVKAYYYEHKDAKPDLVISVNDKKIFLSIKSGRSSTMHSESINTFFDFLSGLNVPSDVKEYIYLYHYGYFYYGDKSKPLTRDELIKEFPEIIYSVNSYFSNNNDILQEIIYRAIIRGRFKYDLVDYLYYGNVAKGYLLSVTDIIKLILNTPNWMCQSICFNTLVYVSNARNIDNERRHSFKINWPILSKWFYDDEFLKRYG